MPPICDRFKLPANLNGDIIILQWHYVTGNSCVDVGYDKYNFPSGWGNSNLSTCPQPISLTGEGAPEQVRAKVSILDGFLSSSMILERIGGMLRGSYFQHNLGIILMHMW